jgi:hypothetical protein
MKDLFADTRFGKIALKKLDDKRENFMLYEAERVGDGDAAALKCTGAVFRKALKGPRKGEICVRVAGTDRTAYVAISEIHK